uniref:Proline-rich family protein n=1 Tax=Arundo donax TaxID=35708 RepID=A0A0A9HAB9_ARUDO
MNIPARGENRDLLNVDGDRNDYDWLLTPPETPLFRSLDDEEDQRIGMVRRGRAQIKPISISRSSTMENTQRSNRSSASPSRLSPSPRSCSSTVLTRTRSSNSSSQCSTPLALQSSIPSRRSSTPPGSNTLTPPRRSPSPASRRMSTNSSGPMLNGRRSTSPVKANQRSSSPKIHGWQSSDPGFSFDAPPNLRTSLSDHPISRSRGGSPSSFSGLDIGWRGRRQSMSPTTSRRASSSHSNDRDRFSTYSKASTASSAEDDLDSMQSVPISYSSSPAVKKDLAMMKSRTIASSKKPSKSFSPSSAPKRSFDSSVWLMDHRKAPQDMFRPLLSGVPSTTFGVAKGNDPHRPMLSHNSSFTTSSNASSEHGATYGPCVDKGQERHDVVGEHEVKTSSVVHDDILDGLTEGPNCNQCSLAITQSGPESSSTVKYSGSTRQDLDMERSRTAETSCNVASSSEVGHGEMATCARCGKLFNSLNVDEEVDYCEECALIDEVSFVDPKMQTLEESHRQDHKTSSSKPCFTSEAHITPDCSEDINETSLDSQLVNNEAQANCLQRCNLSQSTMDTTEGILLGQHVENLAENLRQHDVGDSSLGSSIAISSHQYSESECQQTELTSVAKCDILRDQTGGHHNEMTKCLPESICESIECVSDTLMIDNYHKLGSVGLPNLKAENRSLASSTNILYSEPYYTRDNVRMLKHTFGRDSSSAASSIDQGSSRQSDVHSEHLKSSNRYDFEKAQISSTVSCQSIASMSDMSISNSSVSLCPQSDAIVDTGFVTNSSESSALRTMICTGELDGSCKYNLSSAIECWSAAQAIVNDDSESLGDAMIPNESTGGMGHRDNVNANLCSSDTGMRSDNPLSLATNESCIQKTEESPSSVTQCCSVGTPEHPSDACGIDNYQQQYEAVLAFNESNELDDCCVSIICEEDVLVSASVANTMELPGDVGNPGNQQAKAGVLVERPPTGTMRLLCGGMGVGL